METTQQNVTPRKSKIYRLTLTALFAALAAIGAFLKIPIGATSMTLQFFFTAMAGILLGAKWGAISQAVYVLLGFIGLPIFTMGGGFSYIFQPSFGFLLGLIPCAAVIGLVAGKNAGFWRLILAMIAGLAVLYIFGLPYMAVILNSYLGKGLSAWQIIQTGMLIYLPGDAIKIVVAALLCTRLQKPLQRYL